MLFQVVFIKLVFQISNTIEDPICPRDLSSTHDSRGDTEDINCHSLSTNVSEWTLAVNNAFGHPCANWLTGSHSLPLSDFNLDLLPWLSPQTFTYHEFLQFPSWPAPPITHLPSTFATDSLSLPESSQTIRILLAGIRTESKLVNPEAFTEKNEMMK